MKTKSQGIPWKKIWVLGGMLFLPAVLFYFFLFNTTAHIHRLPFYGPHGYGEIREPGKRPRTDTLYYELPEITLSDEIIKKASVAMNNMMALK